MRQKMPTKKAGWWSVAGRCSGMLTIMFNSERSGITLIVIHYVPWWQMPQAAFFECRQVDRPNRLSKCRLIIIVCLLAFRCAVLVTRCHNISQFLFPFVLCKCERNWCARRIHKLSNATALKLSRLGKGIVVRKAIAIKWWAVHASSIALKAPRIRSRLSADIHDSNWRWTRR